MSDGQRRRADEPTTIGKQIMGVFGQGNDTPRDTAPPWGRRRARIKVSPIFIGIVALAVIGGVATWRGFGNTSAAVFVFVLASYFAVLCLHEFGHAYAAYRAGDSSVEARGYLDLNPLRYLNPVLSILLPVFYLAIGGLPLPGGAVVVNRGAARARWQASLISASGPLGNIVFAGLSIAAIAIWAPTNGGELTDQHYEFWSAVCFFAYIQVAVSLLNLIPVPGLDGYGIIEPYLRYETRRGLEPIRPYGILLVLVLLLFLPPVRTAFSDAIDSILTSCGVPQGGPGTGQYFFQFWRS
jgi:Zn-dependent protease